MKKVFLIALSLVILLTMTLFSATFAQTNQVSYHNGETVPLFQGTLAYQDGFSYNSLVNDIISSDEGIYSAQYYGERADLPLAVKLAVLDGYVVWQFDFVDQIICIDAQNATNAYALPIDGIAYTYIIDDFSYNNAVYSNTTEAASYVDSGNASTVVYNNSAQEGYNISSGGYSNLYNGFATYEEYLAAYMAQVAQMTTEVAPSAVPDVSSYSEVVYIGSSNMTTPANSTVSIQQPAVANTVGSNYAFGGYDAEGYDAEGYAASGYDREGYNRAGYNAQGYDREGYTEAGYNVSGYDREGYNAQGYNAQGYDREGQTQ